MTGFSKMLSAARPGVGALFNRATAITSLKPATRNLLAQFVRESHGRTMFIRPSKFYTKKYYDLLHFWFVLTSLPFVAFYTYQMMFVGPATLAEIPEDYEPRYYEYYRHPVKRFMSQYVYQPPEQQYEITLHNLFVHNNTIKMRALEKKVKRMMLEKQDYKGWYYVPVQKEPFEVKEDYNKYTDSKGMDITKFK